MKQIPVLIIGFNRVDLINNLLKQLEKHEITKIYVALDGPRNKKEEVICGQVLSAVFNYTKSFDLHVIHRKNNLGCMLGVVSALDWFFQQVDTGIILEDDCFPSSEFFDQVRKFFYEKPEIKMSPEIITAHNPFNSNFCDNLSKYPLIHGWATTSETWKKIRFNYFKLGLPRRTNLAKTKRTIAETIFWWVNSTRAKLGLVDTWDGIFVERAFHLNFKCLVPEQNMVQNLGYGPGATHTIDSLQSNLVSLPNDFNSNIGIDEALATHYFKISNRHIVTPIIHLLFDLIKIRKIKDFEKILNLDTIERTIEK